MASVLSILILFGVAVLIWQLAIGGSSDNDTQPNLSQTNDPRGANDNTDKPVQSPTELPSSVQLDVAFTAQAPTANWDELHNEACEEASAIMVYGYFNNRTSLPPSYVEAEISKLTKWQQENFGYYLSITTNETEKMIESVYDLNVTQAEISEQTIKQALADNKLVILPAAGRSLGNPNFTPPGPLYHMLVITGYDAQGFITNDPGTRNGENYRYTYNTLYNAAGNYVHSSKSMDTSDKRILIVSG